MVKPNDKISVEKLEGDSGSAIAFDKVLLTVDGDKVEIGVPFITGKKVEGKVLKQARDRKILVMKYKNKTRYRRKRGHRQHYTEVEIVKV